MPRVTSNETTRAFWLVVTVLVACAIAGGSSRADAAPLLVLRPVTVICLFLWAIWNRKPDLTAIRYPLFLLIALAAVIAGQLVLLPHWLWVELPGREQFSQAGLLSGNSLSWQPISLAPDRTLNSLFSLLPALLMLLGVAIIGRDAIFGIIPVLVIIAFANALLGCIQMSSGQDSIFYLYEHNNRGVSTGFFANRNHMATFSAAFIPILRSWTLLPRRDSDWIHVRTFAAVLLASLNVIMVLISGSRTGLILLVVSIGLTFLIKPNLRFLRAGRPRERHWMVGVLSAVFLLLLVVIAFAKGRIAALDRIAALNFGDDLRVANIPVMMEMLKDMWPLGSGFGSFDYLYRSYEPDSALTRAYFNNAHNDLLELAITGGAPSLLILLAFVVWFGLSIFRAFYQPQLLPVDRALARGAGASIAIFLLASLTDYPLRTPILTSIFALLCACLALCVRPRASSTDSSVANKR